MFAFLLNPGGRRGRRHKVKHRGRRSSVSIRRSRRARRSYVRHYKSATRGRYKALTRRLLDRMICAPGAARRWHAARQRCPSRVKLSPSSFSASSGMAPAWSYGVERSVAANRKRRRNGRRARFHYRRRNASWLPSFSMNGIGVKSLATGFQPDMLTKGAVTLAGFIGNALVTKHVSGLGFMPGFLKAGPGSYVLGLGTAGLTGAAVGMLSPKYGVPVLFGAVLQQIVKAYNEYLAPKASFLPTLGSFDDYATVEQIRNARPLGCLFGGCGGGALGQYNAAPGYNPVTQFFNNDVMPFDGGTGLLGMGCMNGNCMGDYLTRENAANAKPLGAFGYTLNDAAIDGTATTELGSV